MKVVFTAAALACMLGGPAALAQTASETTTTQSVVPAAPMPGTLSTTRETHAVDAYGQRTDSRASSYSSPNGMARESTVTTTRVAPPPPPPLTTTTTSSSTTTTTAPQ